MDTAQTVIAVVSINATGVIVLLVGLFKALQSGAIVTRRENENSIAAAQREVTLVSVDRDMWKDTAQTLTPLVEMMLRGQETTNHLLRSLPGIPEVDRV